MKKLIATLFTALFFAMPALSAELQANNLEKQEIIVKNAYFSGISTYPKNDVTQNITVTGSFFVFIKIKSCNSTLQTHTK